MSFSDLFALNNSIAARLVRILYVVMLVLIAIAMVAGVARGIATMARSQGPRITIVRPAPPPPAPVVAPAPTPTEAQLPTPETAAETPAAAPAPAAQTAAAPAPEQRLTRRELRERGVGPRFERRGGGRNAVLSGTIRVVGTLVAGAIAFMVIRILAEMALAVLKLGERKEP